MGGMEIIELIDVFTKALYSISDNGAGVEAGVDSLMTFQAAPLTKMLLVATMTKTLVETDGVALVVYTNGSLSRNCLPAGSS